MPTSLPANTVQIECGVFQPMMSQRQLLVLQIREHLFQFSAAMLQMARFDCR
jgi:hypothetical protein